MINKQSLWFTMLFSIILVLSIFYVSMGEDTVKGFVNEDISTDDSSLVINESTELVALRVKSDEEMLETINNLQDILLDQTSDVNAKNDAYDQLLNINNNKSIEASLEKIIKNEFRLDSFVKLSGNNVSVFIDSNEHDYKLANDIISRLTKEFKVDKYITVKFS